MCSIRLPLLQSETRGTAADTSALADLPQLVILDYMAQSQLANSTELVCKGVLTLSRLRDDRDRQFLERSRSHHYILSSNIAGKPV